jgi:type I restriction-modification system DNA methylase subunit
VAEKTKGADPTAPDEYRAESIFWVPPRARWTHLKDEAKPLTIGHLVDDAMAGSEHDNPALLGVPPKSFARPALDETRLGQLIHLIRNIEGSDRPSDSEADLILADPAFNISACGGERQAGDKRWWPHGPPHTDSASCAHGVP